MIIIIIFDLQPILLVTYFGVTCTFNLIQLEIMHFRGLIVQIEKEKKSQKKKKKLISHNLKNDKIEIYVFKG
jgi:hypothetical protein